MRVEKQSLATLPDRTLALLSEITASTSRHDGGDDDEATLMRLLADPLLLRQHLKSKGEARTDWDGLARRLSHDLQSRIFFSGAVSKTGSYVLVPRYPPEEPRSAESLRPEPFTATPADRTLALDNNSGTQGDHPTPLGHNETQVSALAIGTCLQILLVVLAIAVLVEAFLS